MSYSVLIIKFFICEKQLSNIRYSTRSFETTNSVLEKTKQNKKNIRDICRRYMKNKKKVKSILFEKLILGSI